MKSAYIREPPRHPCDTTTRMVVVQTFEPFSHQVVVHNSCICNELQALRKRHLVFRDAKVDKPFFRKHQNEFIKKLNLQCEVATYREVVEAYDGAKRRTYEAAYHKIRGPRYEKTWSNISMFVKPDKYARAEIRDKAPRAIQYRTPMFNLLIAKYLKPLEHVYYQHLGQLGLKVVAKGMNNEQRAQNICDAAELFDDPVFFLCDHSKFDSHVTVDHLRFIHKIYDKVYKSRYLMRLLQYQINNTGYSKNGIKYKVRGTRMSGDYDTALGNTLLNHYILSLAFRKVRHHLLLDGDDSVIVLERRSLPEVDLQAFSRCGMETVYSVVSSLSDVEFCRSKLILVDDKPRFARDPHRALSNLTVSLKRYSGSDVWIRYVAGIGMGELAMSNGVPVLGPIALAMSKLSDRPIFDLDYAYKGTPGAWLPITDTARIAYARMFGVSPEDQESIERAYETPNLICGPDISNEQRYWSQGEAAQC